MKNARAALAALLAAAALSLYALAGILRAGAEIERCSRTRQSLEEAAALVEVDEVAGVASFVAMAKESNNTLFI